MADITEKEIGVARIVKPKFLSLVGLPANQVAFKVIRDDTGATEMTALHIPRKRSTTRSDLLICVEFGPDATDAQIAEFLAEWGITEFEVETAADKKKVKCADAGEAQTMQITLRGNKVTVLQPISKRSDSKDYLAAASFTFNKESFPEVADVSEWLRGKQVDFSVESVQITDESYVVVRGEPIPAGEDTRIMEIEHGVQLTVRKSTTQDLPAAIAFSVNEAAFGSWGWGQLDFVATMADVEFCEASHEAIELLEDILSRILYYSDLPLDVRKSLVFNATSQYANFIATLIDALPTKVVRSSRSTPTKELPVTTATQDPVIPAVTPIAVTPDTATPAPAEVTTPATLTRADVAQMITDAVGAAVAALLPKPAVRAEAVAPVAVVTPAPAPFTEMETLRETLRSVQALGESVKLVAERVQSLEGSTTVRSDGGDAASKTKDVFLGMFGKTSA